MSEVPWDGFGRGGEDPHKGFGEDRGEKGLPGPGRGVGLSRRST